MCDTSIINFLKTLFCDIGKLNIDSFNELINKKENIKLLEIVFHDESYNKEENNNVLSITADFLIKDIIQEIIRKKNNKIVNKKILTDIVMFYSGEFFLSDKVTQNIFNFYKYIKISDEVLIHINNSLNYIHQDENKTIKKIIKKTFYSILGFLDKILNKEYLSYIIIFNICDFLMKDENININSLDFRDPVSILKEFVDKTTNRLFFSTENGEKSTFYFTTIKEESSEKLLKKCEIFFILPYNKFDASAITSSTKIAEYISEFKNVSQKEASNIAIKYLASNYPRYYNLNLKYDPYALI